MKTTKNQKVKLEQLMTGILAVALAIFASGCGGSSHQRSETVTFTDSAAEDQGKAREYDVDMQTAQFNEPEVSNSPFKQFSHPRLEAPAVVTPSEIGKKILGIKIDFDTEMTIKKTMTVKLSNQVLRFEFMIPVLTLNTFIVTDTTGAFEVSGSCSDRLCERAEFKISQKNATDKAVIKYVRTTEFFKTEDISSFRVSHTNDLLLREATEGRWPIVRHASRVDDARDLDVLVIEKPAETDDEVPRVMELQRTGSRATTDLPPPRVPAKKPPTAENPPTQPTNPKQPANPAQPPPVAQRPIKDETRVVSVGPRLTLTSNILGAYDVELPPKLFQRNPVIRSMGQLSKSLIEIVPIDQQSPLEPSYRMAAIGEAMVDQKVRISENACNFFVRAVMALSGYVHGPWPTANDFENLFQSEYDGLDTWEQFPIQNSTGADPNKLKLEQRLHNLLSEHAVVFQLERPGKAHGHVALITKEDGKYYFYDGSLGKTARGTRKREVELRNLIDQYKGVIRVHSLPNLLNKPSTVRRT